jgi:hypothetical protein
MTNRVGRLVRFEAHAGWVVKIFFLKVQKDASGCK